MTANRRLRRVERRLVPGPKRKRTEFVFAEVDEPSSETERTWRAENPNHRGRVVVIPLVARDL